MDTAVKHILTTPETCAFEEITTEMLNTFIKKNHDYGNSFEEDLEDEMDLGPARYAIGNKWRRFKQLSMGKDPLVDEKIEDTLLDMANYCVMTLMWLRDDNSSYKKSRTVPES